MKIKTEDIIDHILKIESGHIEDTWSNYLECAHCKYPNAIDTDIKPLSSGQCSAHNDKQ